MAVSRTSIRDATPDDAAIVASIYDHFVLHTVATFECEPVGEEAMAVRMGEILEAGYPYLVAEAQGVVVGFAYAARFRPRAAYLHSVETTVYVAPGNVGSGVGTSLYAALFDRMRRLRVPNTVHSVFAGIALPNDPSVALHERFGFSSVGRLPEAGWKLGRWIDVGYWHRFLGEETVGDLDPSHPRSEEG